MSDSPAEVRSGITGHIYKAPLGTAKPTTLAGLPPEWRNLGYTETLPDISNEVSKESFTPAQTLDPVRENVTARTSTAAFTLWQRNPETLKTAFGGGTVIAGGEEGVAIYQPPAEPTVVEASWIIEIEDGAITDRYWVERASYALNGNVTFGKNSITGYPIELTYLAAAGGGSPWELITNDPAMVVDA